MTPADAAAKTFEGYPTLAVILAALGFIFWLIRPYLPKPKNGTGAYPRLTLPTCEAEKHIRSAAETQRRELTDIVSAARDVSQVAIRLQETIEERRIEAKELHRDMMAELRRLGEATATLSGATATLVGAINRTGKA